MAIEFVNAIKISEMEEATAISGPELIEFFDAINNETGTLTLNTLRSNLLAALSFVPLDAAMRDQPNGHITLTNGKVSFDILPKLEIAQTYAAGSEAEMLALPATPGDIVIRTDDPDDIGVLILIATPASTLANWSEIDAGTIAGVLGVNMIGTKTGKVSLTTGDFAQLDPDFGLPAMKATTIAALRMAFQIGSAALKAEAFFAKPEHTHDLATRFRAGFMAPGDKAFLDTLTGDPQTRTDALSIGATFEYPADYKALPAGFLLLTNVPQVFSEAAYPATAALFTVTGGNFTIPAAPNTTHAHVMYAPELAS